MLRRAYLSPLAAMGLLLASCGPDGNGTPTPDVTPTTTPDVTPDETATPGVSPTPGGESPTPGGESPTPGGSPTPGPVTDVSSLIIQDVIVVDGAFVASGGAPCVTGCPADSLHDGIILRSEDGSDWRLVTTPSDNTLAFVAHGGGTFLAGGYEHGVDEGGDLVLFSSLLRSSDGETWTALPLPEGLERPYDAAYGDGRFVLVGEGGLEGVGAWVSDDGGDTWTGTTLGPLWWAPRVVRGGDRFFIYGEGPSVAFSETGETWDAADLSMTSVGWLGPLNGAVSGSSHYDCCFGEQPAAVKYFHLETGTGEAWDTTLAEDRVLLHGVAAGEGLHIGFDRERLYRLEGAVEDWRWSPVPGGGLSGGWPWGIVHDGERFVLAGERLLLHSDDGSSWEEATLSGGEQ